jgi:hypothetical protein
VRKDFEELSKKGVRFNGPPQERLYGIETVLRDDSGQLVQPRPAAALKRAPSTGRRPPP